MAERRPKVLIALAERTRANELAAYLAAYEGMPAILQDELDPDHPLVEQVDVAVTHETTRRYGVPTVLLGGSAGDGGIRATLGPGSSDLVIAAAIRLVVAGYRIVPDIEPPAEPAVGHESSGMSGATLTHREQEVIALLAEGASNKVIARRLGISVHTAKFHVAAILQKLGAVNRTDAIAIAMREGLVLI